MRFKRLLILLPMLLFVAFPYSALASNNPIIGQSNSNFNETMVGFGDTINGFAPTVSFLFSAVFTIMFLFGVVKMGYAIVTKTGHVMKFSTGVLIWVPISFFFIRILIILMFTTDGTNVTLLASDIIKLIKISSYYTSIGMILVGLVLFFIYRLIQHPEYGRWGKRLWVAAVLLSVVSTIIPMVLGAV